MVFDYLKVQCVLLLGMGISMSMTFLPKVFPFPFECMFWLTYLLFLHALEFYKTLQPNLRTEFLRRC